MFHWVGVLNRFDSILGTWSLPLKVIHHIISILFLDSKISFYSLPLNQKAVFSNEDKHVTIQILIFTIALWDNSTNRSIYNSYEVFLYILLIFIITYFLAFNQLVGYLRTGYSLLDIEIVNETSTTTQRSKKFENTLCISHSSFVNFGSKRSFAFIKCSVSFLATLFNPPVSYP